MNGHFNGNGKPNGNGYNGRGDHPASGKIKPEVLVQKHAGGRPSSYTPEMADLICQRVMECGTLLEAVEKYPELPASPTIYRWLSQQDEFRTKYTRVREDVMEMWADEIVSVANDSSLDPNDRRVKIDTKKWLMARISYRKYGDKLIHSGDPENPVTVLHKAAGIEALTTAELAALDAFTQARLTTIDVTPDSVVVGATGNETTET